MPALNRRLRLLIVGNGPTGIGDDGSHHVDPTGVFLLELAEAGHQVAFLQPVEPLRFGLNYYGCILPPDKVEAIGLDRRTPRSALRTGLAMVRALIRADFVYLFFPGRLPRLIAALCRALGKPYGIYLRGEKFGADGSGGAILGRARFVLTVSRGLARRVASLNANVGVIRPMCDISAADAVRRGPLSRRSGPVRLLFVGRLEAEKGIPELLEAAALLRGRGIESELTLVGLGHLHAELVRRFPEEASAAVRVLGAVEDRPYLMRIYEEADIFVLPTHHEGFPRVLYEAMIKSAVVITTMVGGIPGLMKDGENCLAVPVQDPEAIARAVETLSGNPALMQRLAEAALATTLDVLESRPSHSEALQERLARAIA